MESAETHPDQHQASVGTQILASLRGKTKPIRTPPLYFAGLILVAGAMIVLPLVYLAVIALVIYAVYWHCINDTGLLQISHSSWISLLLYVGPIVVGAILVLFMIKPIFARRTSGGKPMVLKRAEEPLLYEFVDQLCDMVGAPHPREIAVDCQVNAAAGFKNALGLVTGNLVLMIGLPLAAGFELRQLTAVLAHEFGHFAQGSAMRLSYLIRTINAWFARLVFERDKWDRMLVTQSRRGGHYAIRLVCSACRIAIWLTRWILWCLMWTGNVISSFMLRQMEYDADRCAARVVGSSVMEGVAERASSLALAFHMSLADLSTAWREKRLADDLPMLTIARESAFQPKDRQTMADRRGAARTRLFDSHPCARDRSASVQRENAPGIFTSDLPASVLFKDFKELCCLSTIGFYRQSLGRALKPEHLHSTESMFAGHQKLRANVSALQRYFQGLIVPGHLWFSQDQSPVPDDQRREVLIQARNALAENLDRGTAAAAHYAVSDASIAQILCFRSLQSAEVKINPQKFKMDVTDEASIATAETSSRTTRSAALETLNEILNPQIRRLILASSAGDKAAPLPVDCGDGNYDVAADAPYGSRRRLIDALRSLSHLAGAIETLQQRWQALSVLLSVVRRDKNPRALVLQVMRASEQCCEQLFVVHAALRAIPYPYEHTERGATVSRYCCEQLPNKKNPSPVQKATRATLNGVFDLYMRMMSDLAQWAEEAETAIGLSPLPAPKPAAVTKA